MIFGEDSTVVYDHVLTCDSMAYDFDLQDIWLTYQRWRVLQRDYLQAGTVRNFIERAASTHHNPKKHQLMQLLCATRLPSFANKQHLWGNCMLGFTYRASPRPTMTLHSRVTYITWLGPIDLALGWVLARDIAKLAGIAIEDVAFHWFLDCMKIHPFKTVPYVIEHGLEEEVIKSRHAPVARRVGVECLKLRREWEQDRPLEELKFGQYHRMTVRYRQVMNGTPFPSHPVESLYVLEDLL